MNVIWKYIPAIDLFDFCFEKILTLFCDLLGPFCDDPDVIPSRSTQHRTFEGIY